MQKETESHGIILFDGICNFCNGVVRFLIRRDHNDYFRFSPLQSETAKILLEQHGLPADAGQSVIYMERASVWTKSDAFCRIMKRLPGVWKMFYLAIVIPRPVRDGVYKFISRNRYKWFGERDSCMTPAPGDRKKFL